MSDQEKLEALLKAFKSTPAELARRVGVQAADLYRIRTGQKAISAGLKLKLHETLDVSLDWLDSGTGAMRSRPGAGNSDLNAEERRLLAFLRKHPEFWTVIKELMKLQ